MQYAVHWRLTQKTTILKKEKIAYIKSIISFSGISCDKNELMLQKNKINRRNYRNQSMENKEFWHLTTPGEMQSIIFKDKTDFIFGMNLTALCSAIYKEIQAIYTFQLMNNHIHFIIEGQKTAIIEFFNEFKKRLSRYLARKREYNTLKKFSPNILKIHDINHLINAIAYTNRNGYLIDKNYTPFTYPWGANRYFFNYATPEQTRLYIKEVSIKNRRRAFHTHMNEFPENYYFTEEYISPECYVKIEEAMQLFKDSHHYFNLISRRVETFTQIAKELGDKITYTDEELFGTIYSLSIKKFEMPPKHLSANQKIELAKELHYNYNAHNKQISRILHIDTTIINNLFPHKK